MSTASHSARSWVLALVLLWAPAAMAVQAFEFDSPQNRERFESLTAELRCLVCQNQSLADSNAELAQDLRRQVYERIRSGQSDRQIIDFMVARYGEFVLYRPPVRTSTWLLWFGPFMLLAIGIAVVLTVIRRRARARREAANLSPAERERARALLGADGEER